MIPNTQTHTETLSLESFKQKIHNWEANKEWSYEGQLPAIIDFYADWCGPCQALAPILEEIAEEYQGRLVIYKVNTEATPELSALFGIRGIPSLLFIPKTGQPAMAAGLVPKENLIKAIDELLGVKPLN